MVTRAKRPRYVWLVVSREHGLSYGGEWDVEPPTRAQLEHYNCGEPVRLVRARLDPVAKPRKNQCAKK